MVGDKLDTSLQTHCWRFHFAGNQPSGWGAFEAVRLLAQKHKEEKEQVNEVLYNYFQLQIPLKPLYNGWFKNCKRHCQIAEVIFGVCILHKQSLECLFFFLCSSNNNIP